MSRAQIANAIWAIMAASVLTACNRQTNADSSLAADRNYEARAIQSYVVSKITYKIPYDYLYLAEMSGPPALSVTYPGYRPASEAGTTCQNWVVVVPEGACRKFTFLIGAAGNSPIHDIAKVQLSNLHLKFPLRTSDGYWTSQSVEIGRTPYFLKDDGNKIYFFYCFMNKNSTGALDGICQDAFTIQDGNTVELIFPYHLRAQLPQIQLDIDRLMASFRKAAT
jgi:hypothetical protein